MNGLLRSSARLRSTVFYLMASAFFLTISTEPISAHAVLVSSSPAAGSIIKTADFPIELHFNVRIDGSRSRLWLVDPANQVKSLALAKSDKPDMLTSAAAGLKPGAYTIRWQALASDGHITRGEIPFTVAAP